jgi:hypothetical protein
MIKDIMDNNKNNHNQFQSLCGSIFAISPNIRFVGIIDKMGRVVAGGMREDIEPMERKRETSKLYIEFVLRTEMRKDFDAEFGKTLYSYSQREKDKTCIISIKRPLIKGVHRKERTTS